MMCYKDRTYCLALDCENTSCYRLMTKETAEAAAKAGLLISFAEFRYKCGMYQPRT